MIRDECVWSQKLEEDLTQLTLMILIQLMFLSWSRPQSSGTTHSYHVHLQQGTQRPQIWWNQPTTQQQHWVDQWPGKQHNKSSCQQQSCWEWRFLYTDIREEEEECTDGGGGKSPKVRVQPPPGTKIREVGSGWPHPPVSCKPPKPHKIKHPMTMTHDPYNPCDYQNPPGWKRTPPPDNPKEGWTGCSQEPM